MSAKQMDDFADLMNMPHVASWVELASIAIYNGGELLTRISAGTADHILTFGGVAYDYGGVGTHPLTQLDDLRLKNVTLLEGEYPKSRKINVRE